MDHEKEKGAKRGEEQIRNCARGSVKGSKGAR